MPSRNDYGDRRGLRPALGSCRAGLLFSAAHQEKGGKQRDDDQADAGDERNPAAAAAIYDHERVGTCKTRRFPIHVHSFALAHPRIFQRGASAVLRE